MGTHSLPPPPPPLLNKANEVTYLGKNQLNVRISVSQGKLPTSQFFLVQKCIVWPQLLSHQILNKAVCLLWMRSKKGKICFFFLSSICSLQKLQSLCPVPRKTRLSVPSALMGPGTELSSLRFYLTEKWKFSMLTMETQRQWHYQACVNQPELSVMSTRFPFRYCIPAVLLVCLVWSSWLVSFWKELLLLTTIEVSTMQAEVMTLKMTSARVVESQTSETFRF